MPAKLFSRHTGAERVGGGVYWWHREGEFVSVPRKGGELPGQPADAFTRVPILAVLIAGPVLGTAFALFLPAAAFFGLFRLIYGRLSRREARVVLRRGTPAGYVGVSADAAIDPQP